MATMIGRSARRLIAAALLVLLYAQGADATTTYSQSIYRTTAFSTEATDYFCVAAVAQNIRNLATGESRHTKTQQAQLYAFGRAHNRYAYRTRGVDPQGLEATLERFVPGSDWRQVRTRSLQGVLQAAARQMRATGLPAVLFVAGGKHVWTMNGYTATADPHSGRPFRVTQVRFSGPYFPRQTGKYGWFDLAPNTRTSVERLADPYFPYRESLAFGDGRATPWNGYFVAVVPWTVKIDPGPGASPSPNPTLPPDATPTATSAPTPPPAPTPEATSVSTPQPDPSSEATAP